MDDWRGPMTTAGAQDTIPSDRNGRRGEAGQGQISVVPRCLYRQKVCLQRQKLRTCSPPSAHGWKRMPRSCHTALQPDLLHDSLESSQLRSSPNAQLHLRLFQGTAFRLSLDADDSRARAKCFILEVVDAASWTDMACHGLCKWTWLRVKEEDIIDNLMRKRRWGMRWAVGAEETSGSAGSQ
jgi:hypothetical protein